jgi:hypothetical protein
LGTLEGLLDARFTRKDKAHRSRLIPKFAIARQLETTQIACRSDLIVSQPKRARGLRRR